MQKTIFSAVFLAAAASASAPFGAKIISRAAARVNTNLLQTSRGSASKTLLDAAKEGRSKFLQRTGTWGAVPECPVPAKDIVKGDTFEDIKNKILQDLKANDGLRKDARKNVQNALQPNLGPRPLIVGGRNL